MKDIFDSYELCLNNMAAIIKTSDFAEYNILRNRLLENINNTRLYGETPTRQSDRAMILDSLNRLSLKFNKTFDSWETHEDHSLNILNNGVDIIVYVALKEEFSKISEYFEIDYELYELSDISISILYGFIKTDKSNRKLSVILVPAGKMGNTRASNIMSALISKYKPANIVVIGIAGSISTDLQPGDVFIPDSVFEYFANSAAIGDKVSSFILSGNSLPTNPLLLNRFQLFENKYHSIYRKWQKHSSHEVKSTIDLKLQKSLNKLGLNFPLCCKLVVGDDRILGSGPTIGKGDAFINWIKKANRKVTAIEMESAGIYDAAFIRKTAPRTIAIRGISDFADGRKNLLESDGKNQLRIIAIKNVISLFKLSVQAGLFN